MSSRGLKAVHRNSGKSAPISVSGLSDISACRRQTAVGGTNQSPLVADDVISAFDGAMASVIT